MELCRAYVTCVIFTFTIVTPSSQESVSEPETRFGLKSFHKYRGGPYKVDLVRKRKSRYTYPPEPVYDPIYRRSYLDEPPVPFLDVAYPLHLQEYEYTDPSPYVSPDHYEIYPQIEPLSAPEKKDSPNHSSIFDNDGKVGFEKNVFTFVALDNPPPRPVVIGDDTNKKKRYNIVFIKTPSTPAAEVVVPKISLKSREKTLVYVLQENPSPPLASSLELMPEGPAEPPGVFLVNYDKDNYQIPPKHHIYTKQHEHPTYPTEEYNEDEEYYEN